MGKEDEASTCGFLAVELRDLARTTGFTAPDLTGFRVDFALVLLVLLLSWLAFPAMLSPLFTKIIAWRLPQVSENVHGRREYMQLLQLLYDLFRRRPG